MFKISIVHRLNNTKNKKNINKNYYLDKRAQPTHA